MLWIKTLHNTCTYYFVRKRQIVLFMFLWCLVGSLSVVTFKYRRRLSENDFSHLSFICTRVSKNIAEQRKPRKARKVEKKNAIDASSCIISFYFNIIGSTPINSISTPLRLTTMLKCFRQSLVCYKLQFLNLITHSARMFRVFAVNQT